MSGNEHDKTDLDELASSLNHLRILGAVDVEVFKDWAQLNPGGVCRLRNALFWVLPLNLQEYLLREPEFDRGAIMKKAHEYAAQLQDARLKRGNNS